MLQTLKQKIARARLLRDTRGANMVEYIAIVLLVAVVGIGAFQLFGDAVKTKIEAGTTGVESIGGGG